MHMNPGVYAIRVNSESEKDLHVLLYFSSLYAFETASPIEPGSYLFSTKLVAGSRSKKFSCLYLRVSTDWGDMWATSDWLLVE